MRNFKTHGIIIKRKNIGEADRLLTVFTKTQGKIQIKATGIRRVPSRRSAHVELLNHSQLSLYKGQGYPVLTEAATIEHYSLIKEDLTKVGYAYHLCELIDGLCPENQENESIFSLLQKTLNHLVAENSSQNPMYLQVIQMFEIQLLTYLGYWNHSEQVSPNFDTQTFIESIIERKLKSRNIFTRF